MLLYPGPRQMVLSGYSPDSPKRMPLLSPAYTTPTMQDLPLLPQGFAHLLEVQCAPPTISFLLQILPPRETRKQSILCWLGTKLKLKTCFSFPLNPSQTPPPHTHTYLHTPTHLLAPALTIASPTTHMLARWNLPPALCLHCPLSCTHRRRRIS